MPRFLSIDATRGFIIFIMIFVNDLGLIRNNLIPDWMVDFTDRSIGSGMTCVDWGFPGFIFIVGMSIPFAIENHFKQNLSSAQTYGHIFTRTLSLWTMGLLMRNGWPGSTLLGFTPALWETIYQKFLNTFGWIGLIFIA